MQHIEFCKFDLNFSEGEIWTIIQALKTTKFNNGDDQTRQQRLLTYLHAALTRQKQQEQLEAAEYLNHKNNR